VLRCKPYRGAFIYIRLALRFFARLASEHIVKPTAFSGKEGANLELRSPTGCASGEQPPNMGYFNNPIAPYFPQQVFKK
jgi:hypothetical protein